MNHFAFILAIFFSFLTAVPCSDPEKGLGNEVCNMEQAHFEKCPSSDVDLCTPFCVCSCCGMSMKLPQTVTLLPENISLPVDKQVSEKQYSYKFLYILGIWQPPKID